MRSRRQVSCEGVGPRLVQLRDVVPPLSMGCYLFPVVFAVSLKLYISDNGKYTILHFIYIIRLNAVTYGRDAQILKTKWKIKMLLKQLIYNIALNVTLRIYTNVKQVFFHILQISYNNCTSLFVPPEANINVTIVQLNALQIREKIKRL